MTFCGVCGVLRCGAWCLAVWSVLSCSVERPVTTHVAGCQSRKSRKSRNFPSLDTLGGFWLGKIFGATLDRLDNFRLGDSRPTLDSSGNFSGESSGARLDKFES